MLNFEEQYTYVTYLCIKGHATIQQYCIITTHFSLFTMILLDASIYGSTNSQYSIILILLLHIIMNVTDYWPVAREYSIWNAVVAALQFWTADLKAHVLSSAIEQVYNAFFYTISMHLLCQQSEEVLFGHFMTTLNTAFENKLTLEDVGYKSGSEYFNLSTHLRCPPQNPPCIQ